MKKTPIRKGQIWEDVRTERRGYIAAFNGKHGWVIVWERGGGMVSRHLKDGMLWKFYRLSRMTKTNAA